MNRLKWAVTIAKQHARTLVVETMITGFDHRMLVIDGELVVAAKRVPGHVVGDGQSTIGQLVDIVNSDPRRGIGHERYSPESKSTTRLSGF